jgi:membrane fusion protein, heavy metal efflux system
MTPARLLSILSIGAAAVTVAGCSGTAAVPAETNAPARSAAGVVSLPADSPMLAQIRRAPAATADLPTDEIVAPGKIEANPNHVAKVVLPVAGRIAEVLVKTGDAVKKDQPLLTLASPDADGAISAYLSAKATVGQAGVALTKAQSDADRTSDLYAHQAIAHKDVLTADAALAQAKAAVDQALAAQEQALRRLTVLGLRPGDFQQSVVVRSPLSGKVLELSVVPGEFRNDLSAPLMTIVDLATVWVTSQVPESDIRFIKLGERVAISLVAYPGESFEGRVSRIADTVDPQTRAVKVQAEIDNRLGRLRPEMYGSIRHIESTAPTVVVPVAAVVQKEGRTVVFVETTPGRFEQRDVSLGKRAGDVVRVVRGVAAGEIVAVDGVMLLNGLASRT